MKIKRFVALLFFAWLLIGCNSGGHSSGATQTAGNSYPAPEHNLATTAPQAYPAP